MIVVYTGNGKGKTSACIGQAVRALGRGLRVGFGQFMKRDGVGGEQRMLAQLLGDKFRAGGKGFFRNPEDAPEHRAAALELLAWAKALQPDLDMLVLDETLYALGSGLLTKEEVQELMAPCSGTGVPHLVLSGRGLPDWLMEEANLISELKEIKHPATQGVDAQKGIEF